MPTISMSVLRMRIAELEDEIRCAEHDEEMDDTSTYDLDNARCKLVDLREELAELEEKDRRRGHR